MNPYFRPRRSMLYVPGATPATSNKARTLRVDSVILDLGDPILVEMKVESRRLVWRRYSPEATGGAKSWSRVNDLDSPWGPEDVQAVRRTGADALFFPNIESRADVEKA
jgi:citrate lyase subunit beta/citryl-CoA lyase